MMRRVLAVVAVMVVAVVAALPLALTLALGWDETSVLGDSLGDGSDIWIILILVYAVWLPLCVAGLVSLLDRIGVHYQYVDRPPRKDKKKDRRREAAMSYARSQEKARSGAPRDGEG